MEWESCQKLFLRLDFPHSPTCLLMCGWPAWRAEFAHGLCWWAVWKRCDWLLVTSKGKCKKNYIEVYIELFCLSNFPSLSIDIYRYRFIEQAYVLLRDVLPDLAQNISQLLDSLCCVVASAWCIMYQMCFIGFLTGEGTGHSIPLIPSYWVLASWGAHVPQHQHLVLQWVWEPHPDT